MRLSLTIEESNALKGIALLLLLVHHLFYIQDGKYEDISIVGHGLIHAIGIICKVCVAIFVFLSGYALGTTIKENSKIDIKRFYIRRFSKLFLNYWFIWLLFVPIGLVIFDRSFDKVYDNPIWVNALLDFFGLINTTGKYGYNPTWWFYSCIILLYAVFPLISWSISKNSRLIWFWIAVSFLTAFTDLMFLQPIRFYLFPFVVGIFISNSLTICNLHRQGGGNYRYCILKKRVFNFIQSGLGITTLLLLLIISFIIRLSIPYAILWDTIITLIIVLLYKAVRLADKINKSLVFLGKHSFNIFLFHTFIYYLYFPFLIYWSRNPLLIFLSLLASSIVLSIGLEKLKEWIGFYKLQNKLKI